MKQSTFVKILVILVVVGILLTFAHVAYDFWAYQRSSIIEYIAKELW